MSLVDDDYTAASILLAGQWRAIASKGSFAAPDFDGMLLLGDVALAPHRCRSILDAAVLHSVGVKMQERRVLCLAPEGPQISAMAGLSDALAELASSRLDAGVASQTAVEWLHVVWRPSWRVIVIRNDNIFAAVQPATQLPNSGHRPRCD